MEKQTDINNVHLINQIAKTCHDVLNAYFEEIGEDVMKDWYLTEQSYRLKMIETVMFVIKTEHQTNMSIHNDWKDAKIAAGWKFGEKYDDVEKTDPNLVEYKQLSEVSRIKDSLVRAVVLSYKHN